MQVAHYLILTHVSEQTAAAPIADLSHLARPMARQRLVAEFGDERPAKRQRLAQDVLGVFQRAHHRSEVLEELGKVSILDTAPQSTPLFLGILDSALQDEEGDFGSNTTLTISIATSNPKSSTVRSVPEAEHSREDQALLTFEEIFKVRQNPGIIRRPEKGGQVHIIGDHSLPKLSEEAHLLPNDTWGGAHLGIPTCVSTAVSKGATRIAQNHPQNQVVQNERPLTSNLQPNRAPSPRTNSSRVICDIKVRNLGVPAFLQECLEDEFSTGQPTEYHHTEMAKNSPEPLRNETQDAQDPLPLPTEQTMEEAGLDEVRWRILEMQAIDIRSRVRQLYLDLQTAENFDPSQYQIAYDEGMDSLMSCLRKAESFLVEDVKVPDEPGEESSFWSHGALRHAAKLFSLLAALLPLDDVRWHVLRRVTGQEPYVDFKYSDCRSRTIVLNELFAVTETLIARGALHEALQVAVRIAEATALVSEELAAVPPLFRQLEETSMPPEGASIGRWKFDPSLKLETTFLQLHNLMIDLSNLFMWSLQRMQSLCTPLGLRAGCFLSARLINASILPESCLPRQNKLQALTFICTVVGSASPRHDVALQLTASEIEERKSLRQQLGLSLKQHVIPALEMLVQLEYQMWKDVSNNNMPLDDNKSQAFCSIEDGPAFRIGSEKVEVLARCYAFMLEIDAMKWGQIEAIATRPYCSSVFWRQANAKYRSFATFLLAHTAAHVPSILEIDEHRNSLVKLWLLSLLDTGRRRCAWYLTKVLSLAAGTSILFRGAGEDVSKLTEDSSGDIRAKLTAQVIPRLMSGSPQCLAVMLADLEEILPSRVRELNETAPNPHHAIPQWQACATRVLLALARAAAPHYSRDVHPLTGRIKQLLTRVSTWCVHGAIEVLRAIESTQDTSKSTLSLSLAKADDACNGMMSEEGVLEKLYATSYGLLDRLCATLTAWGAPQKFDTDRELLLPLCVVVMGCSDVASGAAEMTSFDRSLYTILAKSLVECKGIMHYTLATIVRRLLEKGSLNHDSHQRAAVNALRFIGILLEQDDMKKEEHIFAVLQTVLVPLFMITIPTQGHRASAACKVALYEILMQIASHHPSVIPQLHRETSEPLPTALQVFLETIVRDLLSCVASSVPTDKIPQLLKAAKVRAGPLSAWQQQYGQPEPFQLADTKSNVKAFNTLLGILGRPHSLDAVDAVCGRPEVSMACYKRAHSGSAPFRPGDFDWVLRKQGIALLNALATKKQGPLSEPANIPHTFSWAASAWPVLLYVIVGAKEHNTPLKEEELRLRSTLKDTLGAEAIASLNRKQEHQAYQTGNLPHPQMLTQPPLPVSSATARDNLTAVVKRLVERQYSREDIQRAIISAQREDHTWRTWSIEFMEGKVLSILRVAKENQK